MPETNDARITLRDVLSNKLDALDEPAAQVAADTTEHQEAAPAGETQEQRDERLRDDKGRFARAAGEKPEPTAAPAPATPAASPAPTAAPVAEPTPTAAPVAAAPRLTTWRKEFMPIQDKLAQGVALTPDESKKLAEYNFQREKEYSTGVSTYKAEAQNAKELQDAITPFLPDLQRANIRPAQWMANLGAAHRTLAMGTPEQKLQMFGRLAQEYGVPLGAVGAPQGQLDPVVPQLMAHIQQLEQKVNHVTSWSENTQQQQLQQEVNKFNDAEKYPHFEAVRGDMAQLLERGVAANLDEAYERAIYLNPTTRQAEIERQANSQAEQLAQARLAETKVAAAAQARTRAVSTKTATPSGAVSNGGPKDRRASLAEKFDAAGGGARM